jgi:group I intron endonuclease
MTLKMSKKKAMKRKCGVYKIVSPNNRTYIGSSIDLEARYNFYKNGHAKKQVLLFRSFEKYGFKNHSFEILCECNPEERLIKEREFGDIFKSSSDFGGLNLVLPKNEDKPAIYSKELREKFSIIAKNRKYKPETLIKFSKARENKYKNGDHPMAKVILNTEIGVFYSCIKEAAEAFGLKRTALSMKLIGKNKNNTSLIYA